MAFRAAIEELAAAGFDPLFGARPLRRVIQDRVDSVLARYLLEGRLHRRDSVTLEPGGILRIARPE
jgi:ATP-dependent Clp protease ATP-binding subunit ClpB